MQHQRQAFLAITKALLLSQPLGVDVNRAMDYNLQHRGAVPSAEATGLLNGQPLRGFLPGDLRLYGGVLSSGPHGESG